MTKLTKTDIRALKVKGTDSLAVRTVDKISLGKPIASNDIKVAIEQQSGENVSDLLAGKLLELLNATKVEEVPLMEDLYIDGEQIFRQEEKDGKVVLIPERTPRKVDGKPIHVERKVPDFKVRKDALEIARRILIAEPPQEKNVNLGMNKETVDRINEVGQKLEIAQEKDKLLKTIREEIFGGAIDADFSEE